MHLRDRVGVRLGVRLSSSIRLCAIRGLLLGAVLRSELQAFEVRHELGVGPARREPFLKQSLCTSGRISRGQVISPYLCTGRGQVSYGIPAQAGHPD